LALFPLYSPCCFNALMLSDLGIRPCPQTLPNTGWVRDTNGIAFHAGPLISFSVLPAAFLSLWSCTQHVTCPGFLCAAPPTSPLPLCNLQICPSGLAHGSVPIRHHSQVPLGARCVLLEI
jgi:hypothetical protein